MVMKKFLFFICIMLISIFHTNFCMFLYQLQKKQTFFNKFLKQKSPRKQISPKQWFYLQRLFLKRHEILDALKRELRISDLDWLKFHNEFINTQIYNQLTLLQTPREDVIHEEKTSKLISIAKNIAQELGINIDAVDIFLSVDKFLAESEKKESQAPWGLSCYQKKDCLRYKIPGIAINKNLIEKSKWPEDVNNKSIEWFLITHELTHLICAHGVLKNMVKLLMQQYKNRAEPTPRIEFLKEELDKHIEKEANEIPLVISEKIFKEIWKYSDCYLDSNCWWHEKIPGLGWPSNLAEIKKEVWDKRD